MITYFTKTSIGYSHIKEGKACQDFSSVYHDEERTILTACDGHGGNLYVRSDRGSRLASMAVIKVLQDIDKSAFFHYTKTKVAKKIKLQVLCEWNNLVDNDLSDRAISKRERVSLSEKDNFKLKSNPVRAYGTTLNGAMIYGNRLICVSLGDGGIFLIKRGRIIPAFEDDEDAVANLTYSMCQEDAYEHLKVQIFDFNELDGVLLCTDGLINPYQSISNFENKLVKPICMKLLEGKQVEIDDFVKQMGEKIGIGDDVTLSLAMKSNVSLRAYREL